MALETCRRDFSFLSVEASLGVFFSLFPVAEKVRFRHFYSERVGNVGVLSRVLHTQQYVYLAFVMVMLVVHARAVLCGDRLQVPPCALFDLKKTRGIRLFLDRTQRHIFTKFYSNQIMYLVYFFLFYYREKGCSLLRWALNTVGKK